MLTKQKQVFRYFCKFITNKKLKYHSVLCWSTFDSDYSLESSWVKRCKLGTPVFGDFLPFLSADPFKLCQVGWRVFLHSYLQVFPEMFDRVQVQALAGPLKDIQRLVSKPLLSCLDCVLSVIVQLEGEPLPQSEVLSTLEQVFIKDLSVLQCCRNVLVPFRRYVPRHNPVSELYRQFLWSHGLVFPL